MTTRAIFWLTAAFLMVIDLLLLLGAFPIGLVFLFLMILALSLIILLKPELWEQVRPKKAKKEIATQAKKAVPRMLLERCDSTSMLSIQIDHSPFVIGRASDCDYVLENMPSVGRHHCRILYKETTNNYYLEDLNSKNGTYVNTLRLVPNTPQLLQKGNMVTLDHYQFIFKPKG